MKNVRLAGRYLLLIIIAFGIVSCAVSLACMPDWMIREGGAIGAAWWAFRYIVWSMSR